MNEASTSATTPLTYNIGADFASGAEQSIDALSKMSLTEEVSAQDDVVEMYLDDALNYEPPIMCAPFVDARFTAPAIPKVQSTLNLPVAGTYHLAVGGDDNTIRVYLEVKDTFSGGSDYVRPVRIATYYPPSDERQLFELVSNQKIVVQAGVTSSITNTQYASAGYLADSYPQRTGMAAATASALAQNMIGLGSPIQAFRSQIGTTSPVALYSDRWTVQADAYAKTLTNGTYNSTSNVSIVLPSDVLNTAGSGATQPSSATSGCANTNVGSSQEMMWVLNSGTTGGAGAPSAAAPFNFSNVKVFDTGSSPSYLNSCLTNFSGFVELEVQMSMAPPGAAEYANQATITVSCPYIDTAGVLQEGKFTYTIPQSSWSGGGNGNFLYCKLPMYCAAEISRIQVQLTQAGSINMADGLSFVKLRCLTPSWNNPIVPIRHIVWTGVIANSTLNFLAIWYQRNAVDPSVDYALTPQVAPTDSLARSRANEIYRRAILDGYPSFHDTATIEAMRMPTSKRGQRKNPLMGSRAAARAMRKSHTPFGRAFGLGDIWDFVKGLAQKAAPVLTALHPVAGAIAHAIGGSSNGKKKGGSSGYAMGFVAPLRQFELGHLCPVCETEKVHNTFMSYNKHSSAYHEFDTCQCRPLDLAIRDEVPMADRALFNSSDFQGYTSMTSPKDLPVGISWYLSDEICPSCTDFVTQYQFVSYSKCVRVKHCSCEDFVGRGVRQFLYYPLRTHEARVGYASGGPHPTYIRNNRLEPSTPSLVEQHTSSTLGDVDCDGDYVQCMQFVRNSRWRPNDGSACTLIRSGGQVLLQTNFRWFAFPDTDSWSGISNGQHVYVYGRDRDELDGDPMDLHSLRRVGYASGGPRPKTATGVLGLCHYPVLLSEGGAVWKLVLTREPAAACRYHDMPCGLRTNITRGPEGSDSRDRSWAAITNAFEYALGLGYENTGYHLTTFDEFDQPNGDSVEYESLGGASLVTLIHLQLPDVCLTGAILSPEFDCLTIPIDVLRVKRAAAIEAGKKFAFIADPAQLQRSARQFKVPGVVANMSLRGNPDFMLIPPTNINMLHPRFIEDVGLVRKGSAGKKLPKLSSLVRVDKVERSSDITAKQHKRALEAARNALKTVEAFLESASHLVKDQLRPSSMPGEGPSLSKNARRRLRAELRILRAAGVRSDRVSELEGILGSKE